MALRFEKGSIRGGRLGCRVEDVLLAEIEGSLRSRQDPCMRRIYEQALRRLHFEGLPPVSFGAVRMRIILMTGVMGGGAPSRFLVTRHVPIDVIMIDRSGRPLGRPVVTLVGTIGFDQGEAWIDVRTEVTFPWRRDSLRSFESDVSDASQRQHRGRFRRKSAP